MSRESGHGQASPSGQPCEAEVEAATREAATRTGCRSTGGRKAGAIDPSLEAAIGDLATSFQTRFAPGGVPGRSNDETPAARRKRIRKRAKAFLELSGRADECPELGCPNAPRYPDLRCEKHTAWRFNGADGRVDRSRWVEEWDAFFKLAEDPKLSDWLAPPEEQNDQAGSDEAGSHDELEAKLSVQRARFR